MNSLGLPRSLPYNISSHPQQVESEGGMSHSCCTFEFHAHRQVALPKGEESPVNVDSYENVSVFATLMIWLGSL